MSAATKTPPRDRALLWIGLGLLAILVLQAVAILAAPGTPWTQTLDDAWRALVGAAPGDSIATGALALLFQEIGAIPGFAMMMLIPPTRRTWRMIWTVLSALLALGMIWQRTLINAHWLSDSIIGILAGLGVGFILWWAFWPWLNRDYGRRPWFLTRTGAAAPAASAV